MNEIINPIKPERVQTSGYCVRCQKTICYDGFQVEKNKQIVNKSGQVVQKKLTAIKGLCPDCNGVIYHYDRDEEITFGDLPLNVNVIERVGNSSEKSVISMAAMAQKEAAIKEDIEKSNLIKGK